jgi:hypothetical protein
LVAAVLPDGLAWFLAVSGAGIISGVLVLREYRMLSTTQIPAAWLDCFAFIREHNLEGRALVVPTVSFPPLIYYTSLVMIASGHGSKAVTFDRMQIRRQLNAPGFLMRSVRVLGIRYLLVDLKTTAPELLAEGGVMRGPEFRQIYANERAMILEVAAS